MRTGPMKSICRLTVGRALLNGPWEGSVKNAIGIRISAKVASMPPWQKPSPLQCRSSMRRPSSTAVGPWRTHSGPFAAANAPPSVT